jgi:hypothetical protein
MLLIDASSATSVFPLAVGVQTRRLFPTNNLFLIDFSCEGRSSDIPSDSNTL